jgi:hypothetical protein
MILAGCAKSFISAPDGSGLNSSPNTSSITISVSGTNTTSALTGAQVMPSGNTLSIPVTADSFHALSGIVGGTCAVLGRKHRRAAW